MLLTKCCAFSCCLPPRAPLLARSPVPGRSAGRSHLQQHEVGESAQVSQVTDGRSGAARSRRAPTEGLCYCGFFRMRPCRKS